MSLLVTTEPKYEAADATSQKVFANSGGTTVYYAVDPDGLPADHDGSIEPGFGFTAKQGYWFATTSGQASLTVRPLSQREEIEQNIVNTGGSQELVDLTGEFGTAGEEKTYVLKEEHLGKTLIIPNLGLNEETESGAAINVEIPTGLPVGKSVRFIFGPGSVANTGLAQIFREDEEVTTIIGPNSSTGEVTSWEYATTAPGSVIELLQAEEEVWVVTYKNSAGGTEQGWH